MARSVNMAIIVGNLTRDPEMRYTPQGHAVVSFGVATNRTWVSDGERREATEFHNIVAWNKLAEICSQLLSKGRKVYIQGRLQTRTWDDQQGVRHYKTEIVADDMVVLDRRPVAAPAEAKEYVVSEKVPEVSEEEVKEEVKEEEKVEKEEKKKEKEEEKKAEKKTKSEEKGEEKSEEVKPKEMPF